MNRQEFWTCLTLQQCICCSFVLGRVILLIRVGYAYLVWMPFLGPLPPAQYQQAASIWAAACHSRHCLPLPNDAIREHDSINHIVNLSSLHPAHNTPLSPQTKPIFPFFQEGKGGLDLSRACFCFLVEVGETVAVSISIPLTPNVVALLVPCAAPPLGGGMFGWCCFGRLSPCRGTYYPPFPVLGLASDGGQTLGD